MADAGTGRVHVSAARTPAAPPGVTSYTDEGQSPQAPLVGQVLPRGPL